MPRLLPTLSMDAPRAVQNTLSSMMSARGRFWAAMFSRSSAPSRSTAGSRLSGSRGADHSAAANLGSAVALGLGSTASALRMSARSTTTSRPSSRRAMIDERLTGRDIDS